MKQLWKCELAAPDLDEQVVRLQAGLSSGFRPGRIPGLRQEPALCDESPHGRTVFPRASTLTETTRTVPRCFGVNSCSATFTFDASSGQTSGQCV